MLKSSHPIAKKSLKKWLIALIILAVLVVHGFILKEVNYHYVMLSQLPQVSRPNGSTDTFKQFKVALLTDLHGCYYGENQHDLVDRLKQQRPTIILLGGDIYDDRTSFANTDILLSQLAAIAPTFYVDGNHEWWLGTPKRLDTLRRIKQHQIMPLMGKHVHVLGTRIHVFGVADPESGEFDQQLQQLGQQANPQDINILLSHRPEYIGKYLQYPFDLVLSGHAHGGQWRLPFLVNGLFAPNQGLFPKYAGGDYTFVKTYGGVEKITHFVVSRGLARESTKIPRFFNRPELVFIDINYQ